MVEPWERKRGLTGRWGVLGFVLRGLLRRRCQQIIPEVQGEALPVDAQSLGSECP